MHRTSIAAWFVASVLVACGGSADPERVSEADAKAESAEAIPSTDQAAKPPPAPPSVRPFEPAAVRAEPTTIKVSAPEVGSTRTETVTIVMDRVVKATDGKETNHSQMTERHEFTSKLEVLEVDETGVTKAKVTYVSRADDDTQGTGSARGPVHPAANKPYLLTREGARIAVTFEGDTKPPPREAMSVADSNFAMARGRFAGLVPQGELQPGHEVKLDAAKVMPLLEQRPRKGQTLEQASLTYRGLADEGETTVAVFELKATLQMLEGVMKMGMQVEGELLFDPATGRLVRATAQGPISLESETGMHGGAKFEGSGAFALDATVE